MPDNSTLLASFESITGLGILDGFTWPTSVPHFARLNVVYGWNYSGKTTLSRAFAALQNGAFPSSFPGASLKIRSAAGESFEVPGPPHGLQIRVFNSDFVRDNLLFDQSQAAPVVIIGKETIEHHKDLRAAQQEQQGVLTELNTLTHDRASLQDVLERQLTLVARDEIKIPLSVPGYDRIKFERVVRDLGEGTAVHLLGPEKLQEHIGIYKSQDRKKPCGLIADDWITPASVLVKNAEALLTWPHSPAGIESLRASTIVEDWVRSGLPLHAPGDACKFCLGHLPQERLAALLQHFESDHGRFLRELDGITTGIRRAMQSGLPGPHETELHSDLQQPFLLARAKLADSLKGRTELLEGVLTLLQQKREDPTRNARIDGASGVDAHIANMTAQVNAIIVAHNARTDNFEETRRTAFGLVERHHGAMFVLEQKYLERVLQRDSMDERLKALQARDMELRESITSLVQLVGEQSHAARQINRVMQSALGGDQLALSADEHGTLKLYRRGELAQHLSDGERTAIAFAYFAAAVSYGTVDLERVIVVIDDPISSLDSHHVFSVYAMVKTMLSGCLQLFVLTHSFEFLVLIRDWLLDEEGNSKRPMHQWAKVRCYQMMRMSEDHATLKCLPQALLRFRSEYHYLFRAVRLLRDGADSEWPEIGSMPNIVRRFLEAYVGIMIPLPEGLEKKLDRIIGDPVERERVLRFVHHYSHNTTVTRALIVPEMSECRAVARVCLDAVQNWDPRHYQFLEEAAGV
jgi:wobble nucleotide-excising tRNase